ncbi:MAG: hypothetical protein WCD89_00180 [Anaerocolumna sp.]
MEMSSYDTKYLDEIVNEFNIISKELLASIRSMLAVIDGVSSATDEAVDAKLNINTLHS